MPVNRRQSKATIRTIVASQQYDTSGRWEISTTDGGGNGMVQLTGSNQVKVFRIFDREGKPIGEIVQPRSAPVVGRGARTVLLVRAEPVPRRIA
jgi:hypothetical protein